ncbi:murein transglycosylase [Pantoea sp. 1.19]|uniref:murein transglycosylase n=1 Tax=Pantoea sp. 1.19 TaxID=1925589 RepID=UPI000948C59E|nr:murein transglycosylase [Pantoea sp. 1.19]
MEKWHYWLVGACLAAASGAALADSLDAQRQRYQQIKQAWDNKQMAEVAELLPTLKDYPLYPYLEYRQLSEGLDQESGFTIQDFLKRNPSLPPARSLSARFVNELARREDWRGLLVFSPEAPQPVSARCNYYYARWMTGQQEEALRGAKAIWLRGSELPGSCDKLITVWQGAGEQTAIATLARIRLAFEAGNSSLVTALVGQLPADYQTIASGLLALQRDPATVEAFARDVGPTDFTRQIVVVAFTRLARQDAEQARQMIPTLARLQKMGDEDTQALKEAVVWRLMGADVTAEQARWRDNVVMTSGSTRLLERRIRMALGSHDRRGLNTWIARLPLEAKEKEEWQYWQADLLLEQGRKEEAQEILRRLMQARGFYPMVAAQRLGEPYPLRIDPAPAPDATLAQGAEIARVRELMYWGMDNLARQEWAGLVANRSNRQQQQLARYALEQSWWDLSVQATITGKLWNNLTERFPLAWQNLYQQYTRGKAIPESYAMAISRQESAWNPKARSPVGATGLMQIMPATAQHTVQKYGIAGYSNSSQLFNPPTNIEIGTQYLESVYQQFGQNRVFAAAAYNAGPGRVRTWQRNSGGQLDAVAWIESIPFSETRGYVKNVLAYDAYYRHFMDRHDALLSENEWQSRY